MTELAIHGRPGSRGRLLVTPGVALFVCVLPFTYYPRLIDGDTQPWTLLAAVVLFALNRRARTFSQLDLLVLALGAGCLLGYLPRSGLSEDFFRFGYKILSFTLLWIVVPALPPQVLVRGVKAVLVTWFLVGAWQIFASQVGLDVQFAGRYVPGRGGVPSLTPEPSMFGMLSALALVYLLVSNPGTSKGYFFIALANVLMSGAILGVLAFGFVLLFLDMRTRLVLLAIGVPLALYLVTSAELSFLARIRDMSQHGFDISALIRDYSINLRVGHVVYTLWTTLPEALIWQTPASFAEAYNRWGASGGLFFPTGSDFILTGAGDIIYRGGLFGLGLLVIALGAAFRDGSRHALGKLLFVGFLLLSQIGIWNVFLVLFLRHKVKI